MYLTKSEYDFGVNTFSPEGRIFQVEYAIEAIKLGTTAIGIQTSEGVVLAAERRVTSVLQEPKSVEKVVELDEHIGCALSGLIADARTMIDHGRVEAQHHRFTFDEPMPVESCTQSICDLALRFGEDKKHKSAMSRPFGVALLIAGIDEHGPRLFSTDPSGTFVSWDAKAIGAAVDTAQNILEEKYHKSLTLAEAKQLAVSILKEVMEEEIKATNIDVAQIAVESVKFTRLTVEELQPLIEVANETVITASSAAAEHESAMSS